MVFHISTSHAEVNGPLYKAQIGTSSYEPIATSYLNTPAGNIEWIGDGSGVLFSNVGTGVHRMGC